MGLITVEGIRVFAYHGHLPEEAKLGGNFIVNAWVKADTSEVEKTDDLNDTVDYVKIIDIVKEQMAIRSDMIEQPARRIVDAILTLNKVQKVKVEVQKITPPIDATFDKISVTIKAERKDLQE
ncbi:MAG: dihydroneopterin aldolase [Flavobacteriales bacterium]|jgi:dihydroneopterin aldolase|nr:dihydroneopterin aldolase [Flavobacteriales bacterium]MDP7430466.1 dihydroneopterin aldolase [Flavobacteriales bacterium]HJN63287.1 dihydroneopterin aldolase [Flavobacteriales bacterium]|tara:strand:- start:3969 stop:4337 length:369 start_codon:yes stop_codon:yes gene_type:complete